MKASELRTEILELARAKLVASREIDSSYDTFSRAARLAVLDVQLSLDFEPRREKVQIEARATCGLRIRVPAVWIPFRTFSCQGCCSATHAKSIYGSRNAFQHPRNWLA